MVEAALVLGVHEQTVLADKETGQVHRLVKAIGESCSSARQTIRRPIRLEIINADLRGCMEVPPRIGPQRFDVALVAPRLALEKLVATEGGGVVEVDVGFRH